MGLDRLDPSRTLTFKEYSKIEKKSKKIEITIQWIYLKDLFCLLIINLSGYRHSMFIFHSVGWIVFWIFRCLDILENVILVFNYQGKIPPIVSKLHSVENIENFVSLEPEPWTWPTRRLPKTMDLATRGWLDIRWVWDFESTRQSQLSLIQFLNHAPAWI